jgi:hypothetical protein
VASMSTRAKSTPNVATGPVQPFPASSLKEIRAGARSQALPDGAKLYCARPA